MRYGVQQRQGVVGGLGTAVPGPLPRALAVGELASHTDKDSSDRRPKRREA